MSGRLLSPAGWLAAALVLAPAVAAAEDASAEDASLARCGALESAGRLSAAARELADHLQSGYAGSHPAAVAAAEAMAQLSATLDSRLREVEPAGVAFGAAWSEFDQQVRRSPLTRDPALGPVLPGLKSNAEQVGELLGCQAEATELVPCPAIPIAHLLAVVTDQVRQYLEGKFADTLPEQVEAAAELARTATALHHVLHDLEVGVPAAQGLASGLEQSFRGSSFTDTDDPEDLEVKTRLAALGEAAAALQGSVGSCHAPADDHGAEGHEGHGG